MCISYDYEKYMKRIFIVSAVFASLFPAPPFAGLAQTGALTASANDYPSRVIIPAIGVDVPIQYIGLDSAGAMAVPDGRTANVGWYKGGPLPGQTGSAVLAAHVYAAFAKLKYAKAGTDVYVVTRGNDLLHFVVATPETTPLNNLSATSLYNQNDAKRLNLI